MNTEVFAQPRILSLWVPGIPRFALQPGMTVNLIQFELNSL